jgi:cytochrome P450
MVTDQLGTILTGAAPLEYVEDIRITILTILNVLVTRQRPRFLLLNPRYKRAKKRVIGLAMKMKAEYLANPNVRSEENRNLIDDIMQANRERPDIMPDQNLRLHLVAPYVAGLDTVANTTAAITYTVLKHPDVLARIHKEVDALFAEGNIDEAGLLKRIPVLNGAIMETMRLYPIAVAQMRCANKDFVFEGCQFNEGELMYIATCVPHFQEKYYPEPYKFDVDRYEKPRAEHRQSGAYSVYGRGPHTCLGKSLAEVQIALSMARIFHRLDLSLETPNYKLKTKTAPTPGPAMSYKLKVNGYRN